MLAELSLAHLLLLIGVVLGIMALMGISAVMGYFYALRRQDGAQ